MHQGLVSALEANSFKLKLYFVSLILLLNNETFFIIFVFKINKVLRIDGQSNETLINSETSLTYRTLFLKYPQSSFIVKQDSIKTQRLLCRQIDDQISQIMDRELSSLHIRINIMSNIYIGLTRYENTTQCVMQVSYIIIVVVYTTLRPETTKDPRCFDSKNKKMFVTMNVTFF